MKATNLTRQQSLAISRGLVAPTAARSFSWIEDMTNDTGADIVEGSVVVVLADGTIELADTLNDPRPTGVALDTIDDGETGQVCFGGPVDLVLVVASVTAGQYGQTSTTPGQAQVTAGPATAFCMFTTSGTSPEAFLWGGRGGGGIGSGVTPGGPAGGDLSGTYPDPIVTGLLGFLIAHHTGALSEPPTNAEVEAVIGPPSAIPGLFVGISDTGTGTVHDLFYSDGSAYFAVPLVRLTGALSGGAIVSLTSAPEGGWSWFEDPRALAHGSYTYIGYNVAGTLKVAVAFAGAVVNTVTVAASFQYDDHDTPTFYYDPINDKLVVWYSAHLGSNIYMRTSTNTLTSDPDLSGGFGSATDLATTFESSSDRYFTYPSPVYTNNSDSSGDDEMWIFYRSHVNGTDAEWHYNGSIDAGTTWPGLSTHLHSITYSKIVSDGVGKIHLACSEYPPESDATKIYHLYRESAAWHQSDGTSIGGGVPFDGTDMTTVYSSGGDKVWIWDIALDGTGKPYITFVRFVSTSDHRYYYARWTGSAWDVNEITAAGGTVADDLIFNADQVYYSGGVVLDRADPSIVYLSKVVSGQHEVWRYMTADGGTTWVGTALTSGSSAKQFRPVGVRDADDIAAVWLYGTYDDYSEYSLGIKGYLP